MRGRRELRARRPEPVLLALQAGLVAFVSRGLIYRVTRAPLIGAQPHGVVGACLAELLATGTNFRVMEATANDQAQCP